jgi:hypothetical protein
VHENQLAYLPFARSGRAEALLFDKYPELAERIERGKRAKIDAIVLSNKFSDDGNASTSFRAQSLEELSTSPLRTRTRRKASKESRTDPGSPAVTPALKSKNSVADLIFEMSEGEDEDVIGSNERIPPPRFTEQLTQKQSNQTPIGSLDENWAEVRRKSRSGFGTDESYPLQSPSSVAKEARIPGKPWGTTAPLEGVKLDLKDIMTQTSTDKTSNLTLGLSQEEEEAKFLGSINAKMTQKERKRRQQAQALGHPEPERPQPTPPTISPWSAVSRKPNISPVVTPSTQLPSRTSSTPQMTMRQTVAKNGGTSKYKNEQDIQQPVRRGSIPHQPSRLASGSTPTRPTNGRPPSSSGPSDPYGPGMSVSTTPIPTPHSVRHIPLPSHSPTSPSQHLSMMEILSIQQAEKISVIDAKAKRSLQEIQQEQEFQEWWELESRRVMEEEEATKRLIKASGNGKGRGKPRAPRGKAKAKERREGDAQPGASAVPGVERGKGSRDVSKAPETRDAASPKIMPKPNTPRGDIPRGEAGDRGRGRGRGGQRGGRGGIGRGGRGGGPSRGGSDATTIPTTIVRTQIEPA